MKKLLSLGILATSLMSTSLMADPELVVGIGGKYSTLNVEKMSKTSTGSFVAEGGFLFNNTHYLTLKLDLGNSYSFEEPNSNITVSEWNAQLAYKYKWVNNSKFSPFIGGSAGVVNFNSSGSFVDAGIFDTYGAVAGIELGSFYSIDKNWELELGFNYARNFVDFEYTDNSGYFNPDNKYSGILKMNYKW